MNTRPLPQSRFSAPSFLLCGHMALFAATVNLTDHAESFPLSPVSISHLSLSALIPLSFSLLSSSRSFLLLFSFLLTSFACLFASQSEKRMARCEDPACTPIGFYLVRSPWSSPSLSLISNPRMNRDKTLLVPPEPFADCGRSRDITSNQLSLLPGFVYIFHPHTLHPDTEDDYRIELHSDHPITVQPIKKETDWKVGSERE